MPSNMHGFYLRTCYLANQLSRGEMVLDEVPLDLGTITNDTYIVAAIQDHIALWDGSYISTQILPGADVEFVLSSSGHIAGIVNPPSPKAWYRTNHEHPAEAHDWLEASTQHEGSWWEHWAEWMSTRSGDRVAPPPMGGDVHPPIEAAPGSYVLEK
ncbi:MAG: hypothetical protein R2878_05645 [Thermoleophilia bacterium]